MDEHRLQRSLPDSPAVFKSSADVGKSKVKQQNKDIKSYCARRACCFKLPSALTRSRLAESQSDDQEERGGQIVVATSRLKYPLFHRVVEHHEDDLTEIIRSDEFNVTKLPETLCAKMQKDCVGVR